MTNSDLILTSKTSFDAFMDRLNNESDFRMTATLTGELSYDAYQRASLLVTDVLQRTVFTSTICEYIRSYPDMKPAKAIAKCIKLEYGEKLDDTVKEKLGQYLKPPEPQTITVRFSLGCDGSASEYYHSGSCYWGCYAKSRDLIESSGGGAVRMYDHNDQIIARAWFVPYHDDNLNGIIIFNAYGRDELGKIDRQGDIVARVLGVQSQLTSMNVNTYDIFINTPRSMLLGTVKESSLDPMRVYVNLEEPFDPHYSDNHDDDFQCEDCNEWIHEDSVWFVDGGERYVCEDCLGHYTYVSAGDRCYRGEYWYEDNVIDVDGETYHIEDSNLIQDTYGDYHLVDGDDWTEHEGEIYPNDEIVIDVYGDTHLANDDTYHVCAYTHEIYPLEDMTEVIDGTWVNNDRVIAWCNENIQEPAGQLKLFDAVH